MLRSLEIKNFAIIDHVNIQFDNGLNIITGETGAGKSILLGALGLTLGARVDTSALKNSAEKCIIEATFKIEPYQLQVFFKENELDFDNNTIVRREITPSGKSRAFINDTPVTLDILKALAEKLVNLHAQNETTALNEQSFQINLLDFVANNKNLLKQYQEAFKHLQQLQNQFEDLKAKEQNITQEYDYNAFLLNEIKEADLEGFVLDEMEEELNTLSNAENIKSKLHTVAQALEEDEYAALPVLIKAYQEINEIAKFGENFKNISERINSAIIELEDLKKEVDLLAENTELDEERIVFLEEKVNVANRLLKKHQLHSIEALIEKRDELETLIHSLENISVETAQLEKEITQLEKSLWQQAEHISKNRANAIKSVEGEITNTLQQVGMPAATFKVSIEDLKELNHFGKDKIEFLFSSNKGFEPQSLKKIASGGELSRVMLSIKALLADYATLPTLIFDEIDTGISGEVATKVGAIFQRISKNHQLISITHLPQIAAKANQHLFIYKTDASGKTQTKIKALNIEERIEAIAGMISGEKITEASIENAKQLIGLKNLV